MPALVTVCLEDVPRLDLRILLLARKAVIVLGCSDSYDLAAEPVSALRQRLSEALLYVPPNRLIVSPTCGLAHLSEGRLPVRHLFVCVELTCLTNK